MEFSYKDIDAMKGYFFDMYQDLADLPGDQILTGGRSVDELRGTLARWINGLAAWYMQFELLENSLEAHFQPKDYVKELNRELAARRKVYQNVPGMPERFVNMTQQRQYDVLKEIRDMMDTVSLPTLKRMQKEFTSIKMMVQASLFDGCPIDENHPNYVDPLNRDDNDNC